MKYLLVANAYPSETKIYSNAFLHTRVKAYQEQGLDVEVVILSTRVVFDEQFDGVTVKYLDENQLADYVNTHHFETIMFHFMNLKMFEALKMFEREQRIVIWLHGFEAEPWYSRYYNFTETNKTFLTQLERKDTHYEKQKEMFKALYQMDNVTFVFVSRSYKELYVDPYIGVVPERYHIIPNLINTDMFPYYKKDGNARFSICNIRPYTAKNYANDITRDVILALSKKRYFNQLQFHLYGDGKLFKELTAPLKKFNNVHLNQGFVKPSDISLVHQESGIYLGPTRHDSQGVSLCEAMCSGLVPISNDIGAIAEFVEHGKTGFLARRDNVQDMVDYIERLINDEALFLQMSDYAHRSIVNLLNKERIVNKEIEVIQHG